MGEIEENTNKQRDILCLWTERILLRHPCYLKSSFRFSATPMKIPVHFSPK